MQYETTIEVGAPAEATWAALTDVVRWPQLTASMQAVEPLDGEVLSLGARVRVKQPGMPSMVWTVTELEPGVGFSWRCTSPGISTEGTHRVEPAAGGGSRLTLGIRQSGPLAGLVGALTGSRTRRYVGMEAEGLRRGAEAGGPGAGRPDRLQA